MLQLSKTLVDQPVLSLRTGGVIAVALNVIINPDNLKVEGWYCSDRFSKKKRFILQGREVRDILLQGIVVNDHDALSEPADLIRLQDIIKLDFELIGKPVVTVGKQKLGKVNDWAADPKSLFIQKIYAVAPLFRNLTGGTVSIDRSQIIEITNEKIVVNDPTVTEGALAPSAAPA